MPETPREKLMGEISAVIGLRDISHWSGRFSLSARAGGTLSFWDLKTMKEIRVAAADEKP